eukprot:TRINITY_DN550_c0_g1_i1.p1 TRINITY_DN550_c0_g1~~TRINITY_DN550_c0_g1_i1.p1  ORF type:complete len:181 (-),score=17.08 TRINITY_DN550_c0_g1_i1:179-721(-)
MEILAVRWGGQAGDCWEFWKVEPCCGEPANLPDALYCLACWSIPLINCVTAGKFFATSLDQQFGLINHCVPFIIPYLNFAAVVSTRHNYRTRYNVGHPIMDPLGLLGDLFMTSYCCICTCSQNLRASGGKEAWDWVPDLQEGSIEMMIEQANIFWIVEFACWYLLDRFQAFLPVPKKRNH